MASNQNVLMWGLALLLVIAIASPNTLTQITGMFSAPSNNGGSGAGVQAASCPIAPAVKSTFRNELNATAFYMAPTIVYSQDGVNMGSEADTAGSTKTYSTGVALQCGQTYTPYVLSGSTVLSAKFAPVVATSGTSMHDYVGQATSDVTFQAYAYPTLTNETNGAGYTQDFITNNAVDLNAGSSTALKVVYKANSASAQFGSNDPAIPPYVCADFLLTKIYKSDVTVNRADWVETDLPEYCANNGYEKAWKIPVVKQDAQEVVITVKAYADTGDNNAKFLWVDSAYTTTGSGMIVANTVDSAGSEVGSTDRYVTLNLS